MMRTIFIYCLLCLIFTLSNCNKDDNSNQNLKNQIKQVIITAKEFINNTTNESKVTFDYLYENNTIKHIMYEGKTHLSFNYRNGNVAEKKYL